LKANRLVNPDGSGNRQVADCRLLNAESRVYLKGYGFILVFRIDTPDGGTEYWATSDLLMSMDLRATTARQAWCIATYHRDSKQFCGIARCMARRERAQRNHSGWASAPICA